MVRARRRAATAPAPRTPSAENPPRMRRNVEFRGKLSHASPTAKITSYFSSSPTTDNDETMKKVVTENGHRDAGGDQERLLFTPRLSPRKHPSTTSVLQQANNIEKKSPHRIEMAPEPQCDHCPVKVEPAKKMTKPRRKVDPAENNNKTAKLTDFFPVRRSVRKTKKTVLEEKQRHVENAILSGREDGLEVHNFEGKGRGIVATRHFGRGDFVVEYAGELISMDEARERESIYARDQNTGCYMYYFVYRDVPYCVDATAESPRLGRLVNHSRNGNLSTKSLMVAGIPRLVLVAKEDIQPGDELLYDYGDRSRESLYYHPWLAL
ncbi:Histone-lysine N-methyltransferase PR-Set7 [Nesidiocoris tenuis]|uniref:[histone H4]-lysine(20) N-methyltransferase n=2 Tax=Nesidiocoris tenuis TaxID=355587 RepID=A0ABN7AYV3_9HEMI|nr:Histone-lysine N-methyltransferase PR-Set7 [Nesidiocoris tenuis]